MWTRDRNKWVLYNIMKPTITVAYICLNENNILFKASLESVVNKFDEILIIDGGSTDGTLNLIDSFNNPKIKVIHNKWVGSDGLQRTQYLKHATGDWILALDCDEVISDNGIEMYNYANQDKFDCYDTHMVHFVYNLAYVDSTVAGGPAASPDYEHFVPRRFFKRAPNVWYPFNQHPVLQGMKSIGKIEDITIYHYGLTKGMWDALEKSRINFKRSTIHPKEFLEWWHKSVLFGEYPIRKFEGSHPSSIRRLIEI